MTIIAVKMVLKRLVACDLDGSLLPRCGWHVDHSHISLAGADVNVTDPSGSFNFNASSVLGVSWWPFLHQRHQRFLHAVDSIANVPLEHSAVATPDPYESGIWRNLGLSAHTAHERNLITNALDVRHSQLPEKEEEDDLVNRTLAASHAFSQSIAPGSTRGSKFMGIL